MEDHPHRPITAGYSDGDEFALHSRYLPSAFNPATQSPLDYSFETCRWWGSSYNSCAPDRTLDFTGQHALSGSPNAFSNPNNDLMEVDTDIGAAVLESSHDRPEPQNTGQNAFGSAQNFVNETGAGLLQTTSSPANIARLFHGFDDSIPELSATPSRTSNDDGMIMASPFQTDELHGQTPPEGDQRIYNSSTNSLVDLHPSYNPSNSSDVLMSNISEQLPLRGRRGPYFIADSDSPDQILLSAPKASGGASSAARASGKVRKVRVPSKPSTSLPAFKKREIAPRRVSCVHCRKAKMVVGLDSSLVYWTDISLTTTPVLKISRILRLL